MEIIKCSSYTDNLPSVNCLIKVAVKTSDFKNNDSVKTDVYENAIYEGGFVSIDNGESYCMASAFIFHKLKRKDI